MNISKIIILTTGLLYFFVFIDQSCKQNWWLALAYFGYAVSNIGLYKLAQ